MNPRCQLVFRSLRFYARSHIGSLLGVTVAGTVLVGALAVGDCMSESLREMGLARLGNITFALPGKDRLFRDALADDMWPAGVPPAKNSAASRAAPVLQLPGTAANGDGSRRANHAQILGVDARFWALAPSAPSSNNFAANAGSNGVVLNEPLARQLGVKIGDTLLLRVQKPSLLSLEEPISPQNDLASGFRLPVIGIASDAQLGRFGLQANLMPPLNAFVPLHFLQGKVDLPGQANLLLVAGAGDATHLMSSLRQHWTLADAQCELHPSPGGMELRSERVFIDPPVERAALALAPEPALILTYFVNELRDGTNATPYSMVTAAGAPLVPPRMRDDQILINQWLADDLRVQPGDPVELAYYIPGTTRRMEEKRDRFQVYAIVPMQGVTADRSLLPDFPGIAKAESTANWDAGFPIDFGKIRPKDEQYWKDYRGTPKAFVTLAAGRRMWGNRFGELTALRWPLMSGTATITAAEHQILSNLSPASVGLSFLPVREMALAAAATGQAQEFGGLFLSFSFFLIAAALILLALLFQLSMEKRAKEIGILLALGWRPARVRRLLLGEGLAVAVLGGLLGVAGGVLYARAILWGLTTLWSAAVAHSVLHFHVTAATMAGGAAAAILIGAAVMWLALRAQTNRPARDLLEQGHELEAQAALAKRGRRWAGWVAAASFLGALVLAGSALGKRDSSAVEAFFGGGALLLIAGIATAAVWFRALAATRVSKPLSLPALGMRGCVRQPKRSLAIVALLASGSFLIIALQANKLDARLEGGGRSSGTGGFAFIGESAFPVMQDLNTQAGRDFFGLRQADLHHAAFVQMRVRDGDEASCLNLNRALAPRLLGVNPGLLDERHAFTFTTLADKSLTQHPWTALQRGAQSPPDEVPAIGDAASIQWALGKKIGDTLDYTDEHGNPFKVRIVGAVANSILQGSLLIDETEFVKRFPGESGYRMFLVDAPSNDAAAVAQALGRALQDRGLELTSAADRLNAFNAVQNTYLNTFQMLGALGLLLGSAGLGVVVLRNVLERRGELAVLLAVGFRPRALRRLVLCEHGALQVLGLLLGMLAAWLAVLPVLLSPGVLPAFGPLLAVMALVLGSGLLWTWAAARLALRGDLIQALREE
jgi:ABC-type lipoprotein release transport system permease subunit